MIPFTLAVWSGGRGGCYFGLMRAGKVRLICLARGHTPFLTHTMSHAVGVWCGQGCGAGKVSPPKESATGGRGGTCGNVVLGAVCSSWLLLRADQISVSPSLDRRVRTVVQHFSPRSS